MALFAISDLHLSFLAPFFPGEEAKEHHPMSIFGENWIKHYEKIYKNWQATVADDDIILMPGDLSWAMTLSQIEHDFHFLSGLNGKIIIVKGNHDYWWQSYSKVAEALPKNVQALQNNAVLIGNTAVCGTRGWLCPGAKDFSPEDEKIYKREVLRLEMTLQEAKKLSRKIVLMMHYRPSNEDIERNDFLRLIEAYEVDTCVYGHLHGQKALRTIPPEYSGTKFHLVSCDYLDFTPIKID